MKRLGYFLGMILLAACAGPGQNDKTAGSGGAAQSEALTGANESIGSETNRPAATNAAYQLILDTDTVPGRLDPEAISGLNEPLRALAAFYAAMGGTNCHGENCELTTALGLGKQGSEPHKALIKNYFPNDPVAATVLKQDCYLRPSGASTFSDFEYLTLTSRGDTIQVDYSLMTYNRGDVKFIKGPDTYLFKDSIYTKLTRNLWTHVENEEAL